MKIAQFAPMMSWGELTPDLLNLGAGGREIALLSLSREWARLGHEVTNLVPVSKPLHLETGAGIESFVPVAGGLDHLRCFPYDLVVSWEFPELFADGSVRETQSQAHLVVEMQVAHIRPNSADQANEQGPFLWAALSPWHADLLRSQLEPNARVLWLPNGIDISRYPLEKVEAKARQTGPMRFIYSSSPDRGLHHLLDAWPLIRKTVGDCELDVCYDIEQWSDHARWSHSADGDIAVRILESLDQPGVKVRGRIGQHVLADLQMRAELCLYPCDTMQATETGCITLVEACAAGAVPITTDCDCLPSEFGHVAKIVKLPFVRELYTKAITDVLNGKALPHLRVRGRALAEQRDWSRIAARWLTDLGLDVVDEPDDAYVAVPM